MKKLLATLMTVMLLATPVFGATDYKLLNPGTDTSPVTFQIFRTGSGWSDVWSAQPTSFTIFKPTTISSNLTVTGSVSLPNNSLTEGNVLNLTSDLSNKVDKSLSITAGSGLSGGCANLISPCTFSLPSLLSSGSCTSCNISYDAQGRILSAANGSGGGGGITTLANGGTGSDLSATGGTHSFLKQTSSGANVTVGTIGSGDVPDVALSSNIPRLDVSNTYTFSDSSGTPAINLVTSTNNPATIQVENLSTTTGAQARFKTVTHDVSSNPFSFYESNSSGQVWVTGMWGTRNYYIRNASTATNSVVINNSTNAVTFAGAVSASNLSGTNTGDQVVPSNTSAVTNNFFTAYNSSTGAFTTAQPSFSNLSGSATSAQMPAFSGDMTTSAGSTVATVGKVNGVTYPASPSTDTVPVVTASNTTTYKSLPDCQDSSGNHLNYTASTHTISCGTTSSGTATGFRKRTTADFIKNTNNTPSDITGLTASLSSGTTYTFNIHLLLNFLDDGGGGGQYKLAYTGTATVAWHIGIFGDGAPGNVVVATHQVSNSFAAIPDNPVLGGVTAINGYADIVGTITTTTSGTFSVQFAQANAVSGDSTVLAGSFMWGEVTP